MEKQNNFKKSVGRRIQKLRKAKDITQKELSNMVGKDRNTLSKIENGNYNFKIDLIIKISEALGVRPEVFFVEDLDVLSDLALSYNRLSERDKKIIDSTLDLMSD